MAGSPPNETKFKKGKSGNPKGRPTTPAHLREFKKFTKDEVNALFAKYARLDQQQMEAAIKNQKLPAIEAWIASGICRGIKEGDWHNMLAMCDRMFGKARPEEPAKLPPIESESHIAAPTVDENEFEVERYVVLMNKDGKFEHARPRLVQAPKT